MYVYMYACMHLCTYVMQMVCMYTQAYRVKNRSLPHRQMVRARLSLAAEVRMCRLHQIFVWVPCDVRRWLVCACVLLDRVVWCFDFYNPDTAGVDTGRPGGERRRQRERRGGLDCG